MSLIIQEITSLKDLKTFIRFPLTLYHDHPCYVPALELDEMNTLRRDRNPAFEVCEARYWLAMQDGKPVGRVAAILNHRHLEKWGQRYIRFSWLDFVDDPAVPAALMGAVEAWAREKGMQAVHGPMGFTDFDREGMLVEGFDELGTLATNYNHPYYPAALEALGYVKDIDWMEYEITVPAKPDENITRIAELSLRRNKLTFLRVKDKKALLPYAREIFQVLMDTYAHLYGYVPLTEKQVDAYVKQYFGFIKPDFVPILLDASGHIAALGIVMPSFSRALQRSQGRLFPFGFLYMLRAMQKNERGDLYLVAVKQEYQGKGLNAILMNEINLVFNRLGITKAESNPELENNANVQGQWKYYQRRQHKRRRCYIKHLEPAS